jgi:hypothetical protein
MKIGPLNIWLGYIPTFRFRYFPRFSFFNGGCYWKITISWFKYFLELSGTKRDNTVYKEVTSEELDKILKELK